MNLPDAIRGAVEAFSPLIRSLNVTDVEFVRAAADIISRHIAPVVKAVEDERDIAEFRYRGMDQLRGECEVHNGVILEKMYTAEKERDQALAKLAACEAERDQFQANYCAEQMISESLPSYEALKQVIAERDSALSRAEAAEALLREACQLLAHMQALYAPEFVGITQSAKTREVMAVNGPLWELATMFERIDSHLSPQTTKGMTE